MKQITFFCPKCQSLQPAWTHDTATLDGQPHTKEGYLILDCLACEPPLVYQDLPPWLERLVAQREPLTLNQVVQHTSPMDNLALLYPDAFADLDDEPLTEALNTLSEVQS